MILYCIAGTCSLAPHILLEHVGEPFLLKLLDRGRAENKSEAYLAINPKGAVPALVVDGDVILENVAIQMYLADRFAALSLAPTEPFQRARWMAALTWMSNTVHLNFRHYRRPEFYTADEAARSGISAAGKDAFIKSLEEMDQRLQGRPWLLGNDFSTADIYAHVFHTWGATGDFPIRHLKNLRRHGHAVMTMPAARRAFEREGIPTSFFD